MELCVIIMRLPEHLDTILNWLRDFVNIRHHLLLCDWPTSLYTSPSSHWGHVGMYLENEWDEINLYKIKPSEQNDIKRYLGRPTQLPSQSSHRWLDRSRDTGTAPGGSCILVLVPPEGLVTKQKQNNKNRKSIYVRVCMRACVCVCAHACAHVRMWTHVCVHVCPM